MCRPETHIYHTIYVNVNVNVNAPTPAALSTRSSTRSRKKKREQESRKAKAISILMPSNHGKKTRKLGFDGLGTMQRAWHLQRRAASCTCCFRTPGKLWRASTSVHLQPFFT